MESTSFRERYQYYREVLNPIWLVKGKYELQFAKDVVHDPTVPNKKITKDDIKYAKTLYASAFHPDTKEVNPIVGRMSFQIPGNTIVTAMMLTFYKTPLQLFTTQWINQSFMAYCNYTNRNAQSSLTNSEILLSYVSATGTAVGASFYLSHLAKNSKHPLAAKFVPFVAVMMGNMVNVPLMRQNDFRQGIPLNDENGNMIGKSKKLGCMCLAQVVATRIFAAFPIMVLPPIAISAMEKFVARKQLKLHKETARPLWIFLEASIIGVCTFFTLPVAVALFPQKSSISVSKLEKSVRNEILEKYPNIDKVYYSKGL